MVEPIKVEPKTEEVVVAKKDTCPWCDKAIADKVKLDNGADPKNSKIIQNRTTMQCSTCGKDWERSALGKPWSIEVERGEVWARENAARRMR